MNLLATPTEIKAAMPDGIRSTTTGYDAIITQLSERVSRFIERRLKRMFHPQYATRYFQGHDTGELWIDDLVSLSALYYSTDSGQSYTALTENTDFYLTVGGNFNKVESADLLVVDPNGDLYAWPSTFRGVKAIGEWGYADERANAWEDSQDTVKNTTQITAAGTTLTVTDADGADAWGITPRFQAGQLLKIESEIVEVTAVNTTTQALTILRGRNGTTAAAHAENTAIYRWRVAEQVKQAVIIQAVRMMERGFQGFGDARATPELGNLVFVKGIDAEAWELVRGLLRTSV